MIHGCPRFPFALGQSPCQTGAMRKKTKKKPDNAMIAMLKKERSFGKERRAAQPFEIALNRANAIDSVRQKVRTLFTELVGVRTARFGEPGAGETRKTLASALSADYPPNTAQRLHSILWTGTPTPHLLSPFIYFLSDSHPRNFVLVHSSSCSRSQSPRGGRETYW